MITQTKTYYVIELYTKLTTEVGIFEEVPYYESVNGRPTRNINHAIHHEDKPALSPYQRQYPQCKSIRSQNGFLCDPIAN